MKKSYLDKEVGYFSNVREDLISFMGNKKNMTVLEVGAGSGATLLHLKKIGFANKIYGFDLMNIIVDKSNFDSFQFGNIEQEELPFDKNSFDLIIIADVLEHLIEPQIALQKIIPYLKDGGEIYISLPNIRYIKGLYCIYLRGDFRQEDGGIFDRTHLRFFCKKNMKEMVKKTNGVSLVKIESNLKHIKSKKRTLNMITFGIFEEFFSFQYFLKLKKND